MAKKQKMVQEIEDFLGAMDITIENIQKLREELSELNSRNESKNNFTINLKYFDLYDKLNLIHRLADHIKFPIKSCDKVSVRLNIYKAIIMILNVTWREMKKLESEIVSIRNEINTDRVLRTPPEIFSDVNDCVQAINENVQDIRVQLSRC